VKAKTTPALLASGTQTKHTAGPLPVSVKRQPTHIQVHLDLPDTQSQSFAKPKELEFSHRTDDRTQNKLYF
jgi:hypothetical protein